MVNWQSKKTGDLLLLANGLVLVALINIISTAYFFRLDLTEEKRYSIKAPTREMLRALDDKVYIEVFLEGKLNAGFRRFQKSIRETLEEFRIYSGNKVQYTFTDPTTAMGQKAQSEYIRELGEKGISPTNVVERKEGETEAKLIFPGALVSYGGVETGVMLLKGNKAQTPEGEINQSIEGVEYELANAIYKLANTDRKRVGLITGHGELDSLNIAAFNNALLEQYDVFKVDFSRRTSLNYDVLVIAKPTMPFSESDKYRLDQFIMTGGKVMFLIDKVLANMDSASMKDYLALPIELNLDDQLFKYGVRINYDLVQDRNASLYPIVTGQAGGKPRMQLLDWPFFPLINHYADHPITRNIDAVVTKFVNSIDTVRATGVRKTMLMMTSQYSRRVGAPANVSVNNLLTNVKPTDFTTPNIPVGYLLEGTFTSFYKNRFLPQGFSQDDFKDKSVNTKIIVIADGDLARNEVNPRTGQPQALGFDPFSNYTFANLDLLMNAMAYLTNEDGLIRARNKEIKIRPLDRERVRAERVKWQLVNLVLPLLVMIAYGIIRAVIRKKVYTKF
ncbi:MAG TPA: gliding motility-associated ABC transporter substrate-binding protein GldG [Cyclobacteriaceae bacterium]|nr:gliding motility-associated ABC transporter substrate-binding protein GldG [Cyclobacteriaceae bacterium]